MSDADREERVKYRTFDEKLRRARYAELKAAAARAEAAAADLGIEVLATGSASRGEVHPWSDLDLLLKRRTTDRNTYMTEYGAILDAAAMDNVDLPDISEVAEALRPGLVDRARPIASMPADIAPLPPPAVALRLACMGLQFAVEAARKTLPPLGLEDKPFVIEAVADRCLSSLQHSSVKAFRRLAVHYDGGQSRWLDDEADAKARTTFFRRLSEAATEPVPRDALIAKEAVDALDISFDWKQNFLIETSSASAAYVLGKAKQALETVTELLPRMAQGLRVGGSVKEGWLASGGDEITWDKFAATCPMLTEDGPSNGLGFR